VSAFGADSSIQIIFQSSGRMSRTSRPGEVNHLASKDELVARLGEPISHELKDSLSFETSKKSSQRAIIPIID
jgi:hypothetical protein